MRLFVAVQPPPEAIAAIRALPRPVHEGIRWTEERTWHITLRFIGEVDDPEPVRAALAGADLGPAVGVRLGPRVTWLNRNVVVVPASGLDDLAARVSAATGAFGAPARPRFDGHLTIARHRRRGRRVVYDAPLDIRFLADHAVLFSSELSSAGATHVALERYALGPSGSG